MSAAVLIYRFACAASEDTLGGMFYIRGTGVSQVEQTIASSSCAISSCGTTHSYKMQMPSHILGNGWAVAKVLVHLDDSRGT